MVRQAILNRVFEELLNIHYFLDALKKSYSNWNPQPLAHSSYATGYRLTPGLGSSSFSPVSSKKQKQQEKRRNNELRHITLVQYHDNNLVPDNDLVKER